MSNIPLKRPNVYDFPPGLDGAYQYQIECTEHYKAIAERAIEALKDVAKNGGWWDADENVFSPSYATEAANKALADIGERG